MDYFYEENKTKQNIVVCRWLFDKPYLFQAHDGMPITKRGEVKTVCIICSMY